MILDRANNGILESEDKIFFNEYVDRIIRDIIPCLKRAMAVYLSYLFGNRLNNRHRMF